jgi:ABC-type oligopeptide transport system substrate-binding subunit
MRTIQILVVTLLAALTLAACSGVETRPEETDTFAAGNYTFYRAANPLKTQLPPETLSTSWILSYVQRLTLS